MLLISGIAAVTMAHTAHFQPVTSAEVEGALSHLVQVAAPGAGDQSTGQGLP
ncbi:MAG TPA: hypothetical protein PLH50_09265 [Ottowia beijingensis]|nr:hypothetical protein [Ottowia beijingensis]